MESRNSADSSRWPHPSRSRFARFHPGAYLGVRDVAWIGLAGLDAGGFVSLANAVPERGLLDRVDGFVATWLQRHGTETGERIFYWVSQLGGPVLWGLVALIVGVLLIRRHWRRATAFGITCCGVPLLNVLLKQIFRRSRPVYATEFITNGSWSFPSGHALDSLVVY